LASDIVAYLAHRHAVKDDGEPEPDGCLCGIKGDGRRWSKGEGKGGNVEQGWTELMVARPKVL
jgi:hypothetical protein